MLDTINLAILAASGLIVVSIFTSVVAFRVGAPLLLLFLLIGLGAGEDGLLGIQFADAGLAYFVGSVCLAVILFDSGYDTRFHSFRLAAWPAITLATLGVVLTAVLTGGAAHLLFGLGPLEAALLGAIVSSTDAAAVFFLLRVGGITIRDRVRSVLEIESGSNDPMAIFLAIGLVELIAAGLGVQDVGWPLLERLGLQIAVGLAGGLAGGWIIVQVIGRIRFDPVLFPLVALFGSLLLFAAINLVHGSGFLAVYVAGILAGNSSLRPASAMKRFQSGMIWLAQITMFLTLGLLATPSQFPEVLLPGFLLGLGLVVLFRPIAVWICLAPFRFTRNEVTFIAWVGLRGAVSIMLAILPILAMLPTGQTMFNIAFVVVLTSLFLQGWTIRPLARWLGLIVPPRIGPVQRFELDLPGPAGHELVTYLVVEGSPVAEGERIPRWARPSLVVRDSASMQFHRAGRLRPGDRVYIFAGRRYVPLLDRLFAARLDIEAENPTFFGDFVVPATTPLGDLARHYGVDIGALSAEETVAEFLHTEFGSHVEPGDRAPLGVIELIVRTVDEEDRAVDVGISLERTAKSQPRLPLFHTRREIRMMLRSLFRRLRLAVGRRRRRKRAETPEEAADAPRLLATPEGADAPLTAEAPQTPDTPEAPDAAAEGQEAEEATEGEPRPPAPGP